MSRSPIITPEVVRRGTLLERTPRNIIYRVIPHGAQTPLIVKTTREETPEPRDVARIQHEWRVLSRLRGVDGVVQAVALVPMFGSYALVETPAGAPLYSRRFFRADGALDLESFFLIAIQAARALGRVHDREIVHRDIKPSNILWDEASARVQLIDFDIAAGQERDERQPEVGAGFEGTAAYASPEQTGRMNRSVDYRSDYYSLGVTYYEWLTGRRPFLSEDPLELVYSHLTRSAPRVREIVPEVPPMLDALIAKLMAKDAEDRYQSSHALVQDLRRAEQRWRSGEPTPTFTLAPGDRPRIFRISEKLYGRDVERRRLLDRFERAAEGHAEVVLIAGKSGTGKSRLVREVCRELAKRRGIFIEGKFDQLKRDRPYFALSQALCSLAQQLLRRSPSELADWRAALTRAVEPNGQVLIELAPEFERVIGASAPLPVVRSPEALHRLITTVSTLLRAVARRTPVLMFIDDLQWSDMGTLSLLEFLFSGGNPGALMFVGAFRDEDVDETHALSASIERIRQRRALEVLPIGPLAGEQVRDLLADTLWLSPEDVEGLCDFIVSKTGGTAFFATTLLGDLHRSGVIRFDGPTNRWTWDDELLARAEVSDDIAEYMARRLETLPPDTVDVLELAACIGSSFDLRTLVTMRQDEPARVARALEPAMEEGLIVPQSGDYQLASAQTEDSGDGVDFDVSYRFSHDQIQRASYAALDEGRRRSSHLLAGRALLSRFDERQLETHIVQVAEHFEQAHTLLVDEADRALGVRLLLAAGKRAQASSAHEAVISFCDTALRLLPPDAWERDHDTALELHATLAESLYVNQELERAESLLSTCIDQARSDRERAQTLLALTRLRAMSGRDIEGYEAGREALALLGVRVPAQIRPVHVLPRAIRIRLTVRLPSPEEIAAAATGEHEIDLALTLLSEIMPLAHIRFGPPGSLFMATTGLELSKVAGPRYHTCLSYIVYGAFLCSLGGNIALGTAFGETGVAIEEATPDISSHQTIVQFAFAWFIPHWTGDLRRAIEGFDASVRIGAETGYVYNAVFAVGYRALHVFVSGEHLETVRETITRSLDFINQYSLDMPRVVPEAVASALDALCEGEPSGEAMDQQLLALEDTIPGVTAATIAVRLYTHYTLGEFERAATWASRFTRSTGLGAAPNLAHPECLLMKSLTSLALARVTGPAALKVATRRAKRTLSKFAKWKRHGESLFGARYWLLRAEIERNTDPASAERAYAEARRAAIENGQSLHRGIIAERAGEFYEERGQRYGAEASYREAARVYARLGAQAKAAQVRKRLRTLWGRPRASTSSPPDVASITQKLGPGSIISSVAGGETSSRTGNGDLDLTSVVRASQALAGELQIDRLLDRIMKCLMENAGAERAVLALVAGDELAVVADATADGVEWTGDAIGGLRVAKEPLERSTRVPKTVLQYVRQSLESVRLDDALHDEAYMHDPYIARRRTKSMLCTPIVTHGDLLGVVYLENDLASAAFSPERLRVVNLIASQAGVSLDNARVYQELQELQSSLQRKVDARTEQLAITQRALADRSRQQGASDVAFRVLHNLGNVLNGATISVGILQDEAPYAEVQKLRRAVDLLPESAADREAFFESDRGRTWAEYIIELTRHLSSQHDRVDAEARDLKISLDHVRDIVSSQWTHARSISMNEEVDAAQLFDDCLTVQKEAFRRHDIRVVRDYEPLPPVTVDRSRVMQIVVNLLSNARHSLQQIEDRARVITVNLRRVGVDRFSLSVRDNGVGIAPDRASMIFARGFSTKSGGQGLGLHDAANNARQMRGSLSAKSAGDGHGASFTLELPIVGAPSRARATDDAEATAGPHAPR